MDDDDDAPDGFRGHRNGYTLVTDAGECRGLVDSEGVTRFTENAPGVWAITSESGTIPDWQQVARDILATPDP